MAEWQKDSIGGGDNVRATLAGGLITLQVWRDGRLGYRFSVNGARSVNCWPTAASAQKAATIHIGRRLAKFETELGDLIRTLPEEKPV